MRSLAALVVLVTAASARAQLPPALQPVPRSLIGPVEAEMRNVTYRVDDRVALHIQYLRGALIPTSTSAPPWFEDPSSFVISIDSAEVAITAAGLSALLNDYVFRYEGSPLRSLEVKIEGDGLELSGTLDKGINLPFTMRAAMFITSDGRLRLRPTAVRVAGIGMRGLMRTFSIELDDMVKVRAGRGVTVHGNDFFLSPAELLPPPRIRARLRSMRIAGDTLIQRFVDLTRRGRARPLATADAPRNYMFYRGNQLRFGKLLMGETDLLIIDADPDDPFDFYLSRLNDQLVAGVTRNQPDFGLVTTWPDYDDMLRRRASRQRAPARP